MIHAARHPPALLLLTLLSTSACQSSKHGASASNKSDEPTMRGATAPKKVPPPRTHTRPTPMTSTARSEPARAHLVAPGQGRPRPRPITFTKRKDGGLLVSLRIPTGARMSRISQLRFTPDGKHLALAATKGSLLLWTLSPQGPKQVYERTVKGAIFEMEVSPNSQWLAITGSRPMASGWGGRRGRGHRTPARRVRFESFLLVIDLNKMLTFLDESSHSFRFRRPSFTVDSKHLVVLKTQRPGRRGVAILGGTPRRTQNELVAFSTGDMKQAWRVQLPEREHGNAAVWADGSQAIYTSINDVYLKKRTAASSRKLRGRHRAGCRVMGVHYGRKLVLTSAQPFNRPHELFLWQMPGGKLKRRLYYGRKEVAAEATFLKADHVLGAANRERPPGKLRPLPDRARGIVRVWSVKTGKLVRKVTGLPLQVSTVTSSSTGWIVLGGQYLHKPGDYESRLLLYPPNTVFRF